MAAFGFDRGREEGVQGQDEQGPGLPGSLRPAPQGRQDPGGIPQGRTHLHPHPEQPGGGEERGVQLCAGENINNPVNLMH